MTSGLTAIWQAFTGFLDGWRQVAVGFVLLATIAMIASCYSIIAVPLLDEFGPSRFVLGLAMLVLSGVSALLSPFLGNLMDKLPLQRMLLLGGGLLAAGYAALSLATSFNHVLIVFGLLIAPANVLLGPMAITVLLSRWFSKRRGMAIGIAIVGVSMGAVVYPLIIQALLNSFAWREAFQVFGLLLLAITIPCALLVIDRPQDKGLHADGAAEESPSVKSARDAPPVSAMEVLTDPTFWLGVGIFGVVSSGMKGMVTNLAPFAIDNGMTPNAAAGLISIYATFGLISKGVFALISDRVSPRILLFMSLGGFGAGMACLTQTHLGFNVMFTGLMLVGLFGGMMVGMQAFLMPRIFGEHVVGKAFGLMSSVMMLALMFAPALFGLIHDRTGSYAAIFYALAGLAIVAMLGVMAMRLHPRRTVPAGEGVAVPAE